MTSLSISQKIFQPPLRSNFIPTMSPLPVILNINLSAKSNHKLIEEEPHSSKLNLSKVKTNFDFYISTLIKKASKKCHNPARVCNHMNLNKRRCKINTFIISILRLSTKCMWPGLEVGSLLHYKNDLSNFTRKI